MILVLPSIISVKDNFFKFSENRDITGLLPPLLPSTPAFFSLSYSCPFSFFSLYTLVYPKADMVLPSHLVAPSLLTCCLSHNKN